REEIEEAVLAVIASGQFIKGKRVAEFEEQFARYLGVNHCLGVGNGTGAIEIALSALSLPPASEVIVPANTFIATSEAVTSAGHQIVFCDCAEDYNIDLDDLQRKITSKTRAIIPV